MQIQKSTMTAEEWLSLSHSSLVTKALEHDAYLHSYAAITAHFSKLGPIDWNSALVGLHIVYGWVPTIPTVDSAFYQDRTTSAKQTGLLDVLNRVHKTGDFQSADLDKVKEFTNNSYVGASKLLHFLDPAHSPIWDRRVAETFLWCKVSQTTVNSAAHYFDYRQTLKVWSQDQEVTKRIHALRSDFDLIKRSSDLRILEVVLFYDNCRAKGLMLAGEGQP